MVEVYRHLQFRDHEDPATARIFAQPGSARTISRWPSPVSTSTPVPPLNYPAMYSVPEQNAQTPVKESSRSTDMAQAKEAPENSNAFKDWNSIRPLPLDLDDHWQGGQVERPANTAPPTIDNDWWTIDSDLLTIKPDLVTFHNNWFREIATDNRSSQMVNLQEHTDAAQQGNQAGNPQNHRRSLRTSYITNTM